jgi:hypothetical protein
MDFGKDRGLLWLKKPCFGDLCNQQYGEKNED